MKNMNVYVVATIVVFFSLVMVPGRPASALDTTEPFELGVSDFETYLTVSNLNEFSKDRGKATLRWDSTIDVGITDLLSGSFTYGMESNGHLKASQEEFGLGLFYNLLDSNGFDMDLFGGIGSRGGIGIGTEMNLDLKNLGFQLTLVEQMGNKGNPEDEINFVTNFIPLVHYRLSDSIQVLSAIDFSLDHNPIQGG